MSNSPGIHTTGIGGIRIGTELNQTYKIDSLIGVGGMGEVFQGHNIQTGDPVAIKVVLPEFARDDMILDLFRKEARILNHLSHDAIVRYHVFSMDRSIGRPYLAMEFVGGPSLAERIKSGPLPEDDVAYLVQRLADGLHKAHEAGVIHRDMSPDNVILPDGKVKSAKIIDFGIARSANVGGATLLGGSFAGKYNYVSPEQLGLYGGDVTPQSDIYSLALVLAAALRGSPIDMHGSQVDVIEKRRSVPDLSAIPPRFQGLLSAMLAPDPARRLRSMADVRDWVLEEPARNVEAGDATVISHPGRAAPMQMSVPPPQVTAGGDSSARPGKPAANAEKKRSGKAGILLIGGALVTVVALGVLGGLFFVDLGKPGNKEADVAVVEPAPPPVEPTSPSLPGPALQPQPGPEPVQPEQPKSGEPDVDQPGVKDEQPKVEQPKTTEPVAGPASGSDGTADEIRSIVASFDKLTCVHIEATSISATGADIVAFSETPAKISPLGQIARQKTGVELNITNHIVSRQQCPVVTAFRDLSSPEATPLRLVMASSGRSAATAASGKVLLEASILNAGPRNISILMVSDDGGIQNINRICAKCLSFDGDVLKVRLPLASPLANVAAAAERPVLLIAVASPRNLFSISSQSIFRGADVIPELAKEVSQASDVSAVMGYFSF